VLLPENYPSSQAPIVELQAAHISPELLIKASQELEALFCPGEVCLFTYADWLKTRYEEWTAHPGTDEAKPAENWGPGDARLLEQLQACAIDTAKEEEILENVRS
jgi:hypothetical protein